LYGTSKFNSSIVLTGAGSRTINFTPGFREAVITLAQVSTAGTGTTSLSFPSGVSYFGGTTANPASGSVSTIAWTGGNVTLWNNAAPTNISYIIRITLLDDVPAQPIYLVTGSGHASTNVFISTVGYVTTNAPFASVTYTSGGGNFDNGVMFLTESM